MVKDLEVRNPRSKYPCTVSLKGYVTSSHSTSLELIFLKMEE